METHIGLELCTAGTAEKITVNDRCAIVNGTLMILSPVFPMVEISRSEDYRSVVLQDAVENIMPILASHFPTAQNIPAITPYMQLNAEQQHHFLHSVERIKAKEQELCGLQHPMQRKLMTTVIGLLKQETLLEHAVLFSAQLLQQEQKLSRGRQVMLTFLLSLNMEYRQHRTVGYYADKQGLTPRHFSDIVKKESGYTPMGWINMVTVNQAKSLLLQPDMQVKQVADELGFPEQFTFRKYFKTHTGISPRAYREKN